MTPFSAPLDSRRFQSALLLLLGPLFIGVSFALMLRRVEPVTTLFYLCAWCLHDWPEHLPELKRMGKRWSLIETEH